MEKKRDYSIQRNSNLEVYRIICMFMVVVHHYCVHGFALEFLDYDTNKYVLDILSSWGKVGVDGFILLSSYFMVQSRFTARKLLKLWGQVWFYTVAIFCAFFFTGNVNQEIGKLLFRKSFFPISYSMYWFVTYYVILMVLSPFLNQFIRCLEKKMYQRLLAILIVLWSIMGSFFETDYAFTMFGWFVTLFLVAGYVRLYMPVDANRARKYGIGAIVFAVAIVFSTITRNVLGLWTENDGFWKNSRIYVDQEQDFLVFAFAFLSFMYLLNKKPRYNKAVNFVASLSFGVYLLHDNYFTRVYLWMVWLKLDQFYLEKWLGLAVVGISLGVYIVASLIDCIRKYSVEKLWLKIVDFILPKMESRIAKIQKRG